LKKIGKNVKKLHPDSRNTRSSKKSKTQNAGKQNARGLLMNSTPGKDSRNRAKKFKKQHPARIQEYQQQQETQNSSKKNP